MTLTINVEYIDREIELRVERGMGEMTPDGNGGLDLKLGGVVPEASVMEIVESLGGDGDANIREALEGLIPLIVDMRTTAKANKDWGTADKIRDVLSAHGITIQDGKDGSSWTRG